ncbi:hypothetical protein [Dyadobacter psychrotolerans]|uniref:Uncharacterized protein n=1 Tax=Dyadobacter psychrotolerans TaxID=2541721 RepID=A0A4R5DT72_9BACT|nr:hypothetical protein [Dyadobacter psychrotolerans]TDE15291.1 hypothetical protein E0F88_12265 [Dyadobacter psychrotolerans]
MNGMEYVLASAERRNLPFWKLYRGTTRLSVCDVEENPVKSREKAIELLQTELENRPGGNYKIVFYKNSNGEKGGFTDEFTLPDRQPSMSLTRNNFNPESDYERMKREIETSQRLVRIEEKLDALALVIYTQADEDKENDIDPLEKLGKVFNLIKTAKSFTAGPNGFSNVTI